MAYNALHGPYDAARQTWTVPPDHEGLRENWRKATEGLVRTPLDFAHPYTLDLRGRWGLAPLCFNFGVVLFPQASFNDVAERYLDLRPQVEEREGNEDFSGP